jgi:DNA-binding IclR family transcriptional regulator
MSVASLDSGADAGNPSARGTRAGGTRPPGPGMVTRSVALLTELGAAAPATLSELARRTGLPKTTTYRLLGLLQAENLVKRSGNQYRPGTRLTRLAAPATAWQLSHLRPQFLPHLIDLYEATRQTVSLAVLEDDEIRHVERIYGHNRVRSPSDGTGRAPARRTAAGKLLLAWQPGSALAGEPSRIRQDGIACSYGELAPGVCCVAAPVRDPRGVVITAITVASRPADFDPARTSPHLRHAAHAITRALRGHPDTA